MLSNILTLYLLNLRTCDVGITDGKDLKLMPLRWTLVPLPSFVQVGSAIQNLIEGMYIKTLKHPESKVI
jgi:hypothetical protein